MTWYQLWKRIGRQPLKATRNKDVMIKINNKEYKCKLVYTDNGSDWHLELDYKINEEDRWYIQ